MNQQGLNIIFAGTPDFAAYHLQVLLASHHNVVAVYTQPDRPSGRGKKLTAGPVKILAEENNLPVEQPPSLKNSEAQEKLASYQADIMVVVAYGLLLPQIVLDTPRYGCLNVHGSLLPRWRGAAPIQRAIEAGDKETGITIMQMDKGLDTGDMLLKVSCEITPEDTSLTLHDKLKALGGPALLETLQQVEIGQLTPEKQNDSQACYADKITKQEAEINWQEPAAKILKKIRAFNPFPVAYSFFNEERVKIYTAKIVEKNHALAPGKIIQLDENSLQISSLDKAIAITLLQIPGKKVMTPADIVNGYSDKFLPGKLFSSDIND